MKKYTYSENEEWFDNKQFYTTRSLAIQAGYEDQEIGLDYMVCEVEQILPERYVLSAKTFLKMIESEVFADVGKVSNAWLEQVSEVKQARLRRKLQAAFENWLTENELQPAFYKARYITYHCNEEKINHGEDDGTL